MDNKNIYHSVCIDSGEFQCLVIAEDTKLILKDVTVGIIIVEENVKCDIETNGHTVVGNIRTKAGSDCHITCHTTED